MSVSVVIALGSEAVDLNGGQIDAKHVLGLYYIQGFNVPVNEGRHASGLPSPPMVAGRLISTTSVCWIGTAKESPAMWPMQGLFGRKPHS